jgi:hypothetical protein
LRWPAPTDAWRELVEPDLPDYLGQFVLEDVAQQHLARFAGRYGLPMISGMGRWWSRRQDVEIDLVAELHDGSNLFGEVKWASGPCGVALACVVATPRRTC